MNGLWYYVLRRPVNLCLALSVLLASACASGKTMMEGIDVPLEDMNAELTLAAPSEGNTFIMWDVVTLVMENTTETSILITQESGIHVFRQQAAAWVPVDNNFSYAPSEVTLLPKPQETFGGKSIALLPNILEPESTEIRVIIVGQMDGRLVAGYIDLVLDP